MRTIVQLTASRFYGAPERQILELGRALSESWRTVIVSFSEGGLCREFLAKAAGQGFPAVCLDHDTPRLAAALGDLTQLLSRAGAEGLCCHGYKANLLGLLAARRLRIPVVAVSRGWTAETWRVRLYEVLDRRVLGRMDRVVCVSHAQAQKVRRAGVPRQKTVVIHDAVRADRFPSPRNEDRVRLEQLFAEPPKRIVGAAGRLSPEKGFDVLIDAASEVLRRDPSVGFVLYGDGRLRGALAGRVRERKLEGRFVLAGFCSELDRLFPCFDLFVLPSFTEGLPNVVLEAFAAGVPVVATAVGGTPEVVRDGHNGYLVPPGDSAALAKRIADALCDQRQLRKFGERGRQRVERCFSFASQAESYVRLLAGLGVVEAPPPGSQRRPHAPREEMRHAERDDYGTSPRHRSRPVRVCFMIDNLSGKTNQVVLGGSEQQLLTLIEQLDRRKVSPYLCLLDGENEASRSVEPDGCPVLRLGVRSLRRPSTLAAAWRFVRYLRRERIDLLKVNFPDSTRFGVTLARLAGVRRIVGTREDLGHWMTPADRRLGRLYSRLIDATVANSEACRRSVMADECAPGNSVFVIPNGIDGGRFAHIPEPSAPGRDGRPPRVGALANLRPVKNVEMLVRAASLLAPRYPELRFQVAGEGSSRSELQRLIRQLGLAERFELLGAVTDVAGFLSGLDVAVLCSRAEGLPNAILEYMAAGRPIVATSVGGNGELIDDGEHGLLVPSGDERRLAAAIDRLLRDRALAARLASAARRHALHEYGLERLARRHESLFHRLLFGENGATKRGRGQFAGTARKVLRTD
jgi:glycosyltransferase involved in cell wall biosynthesis